ncbi:MAG: ABC transporter ATP-binding protein [Desulfatiglans sp.]|jgi:branched-chain amino acid transport system ATP-binding protein|nr:ABC transporter ATP-binding protein [Thermodesulfobacteriota bacterium]MEE4353324.1 ABC transporter ATP-binding protein [Desulfatiglans sp.]
MFLEVNKINTYYGVFQAIFDVSLGLREGEIVCLLGRNGAGKSTTLTSIIGLNKPESGSIRHKNEEIIGIKPYQIARRGIGFVPEDRWVFSELTVKENLEIGLRRPPKAGAKADLERIYELFPKLKSLEKQHAGILSGGEQQMLTVGRTLMGSPELILLDEPTAGLAPVVAKILGEQIKRLKQAGLTILLTEQNALLAMSISDRSYVIDKGTIVYDGTVKNLAQDEDTMRGYLGV